MVTLVSTSDFLGALRKARDIALESYVLQPQGNLFRALKDACMQGAHVVVRLEKNPYLNEQEKKNNETVVQELQASGADIQEIDGAHLKAAVIDGRMFLDDCNWKSRGDTIVRDTNPDHVKQVEDAFRGKTDPPSHSFATTKDGALAEEYRLLHAPKNPGDVIVETESFGNEQISSELCDLAKRGLHVRLLAAGKPFLKSISGLNTQEIKRVRDLEKAGVEVRVSTETQKFAVLGGRAWLGSANATVEDATLIQKHIKATPEHDWGMLTANTAIVSHLEDTYERNWENAMPFSEFSQFFRFVR